MCSTYASTSYSAIGKGQAKVDQIPTSLPLSHALCPPRTWNKVSTLAVCSLPPWSLLRTGLWRCRARGEAGDVVGLRPDVVRAYSYSIPSERNNMSKCCPVRHHFSDDLDPYGCGNRQASDGLVTTPFLRVTAETLALSSTCKAVAGILNALAIIVVVEKVSCNHREAPAATAPVA